MMSNIKCEMTAFTKITYEAPCRIDSSCKIIGGCEIGAYTYLGEGCLIGGGVIGRYCSIAPGVKIGLGEHEPSHVSMHPIFFGSKHSFNIPDGIGTARDLTLRKHQIPRIGNDVWIGANAIICRGVNIGNGAIIAAGSIVRHDVEPYSIVGGVPAKYIKKRFPDELIDKLQNIKWWDYDLSTFIGLDASDTQSFISNINPETSTKASYKKFVSKENEQPLD